MSKWKPGNLVTVNGIVYRVKRESEQWTSCYLCEFGDMYHCSLPVRNYGKYPLAEDCYLKRLSPKEIKPKS